DGADGNRPASAGVLSLGRYGSPCRTPWAHAGGVRRQPHIGPPSRRAESKGSGSPNPFRIASTDVAGSLAASFPLRPLRPPAPHQDSGPSRSLPAFHAIGKRDATCHPRQVLSREISAIRHDQSANPGRPGAMARLTVPRPMFQSFVIGHWSLPPLGAAS